MQAAKQLIPGCMFRGNSCHSAAPIELSNPEEPAQVAPLRLFWLLDLFLSRTACPILASGALPSAHGGRRGEVLDAAGGAGEAAELFGPRPGHFRLGRRRVPPEHGGHHSGALVAVCLAAGSGLAE